MRYSQAKQATIALFNKTASTPVYLSGKPGLGKTSLAYDVAAAMDIPTSHVVVFRPSLRDPVDLNA